MDADKSIQHSVNLMRLIVLHRPEISAPNKETEDERFIQKLA